ncbi:interferon-induced protein 44-like [Gigantopelta aegis]|uniref:interferon-induced protein 44-like n=1 Tax=Gigantopelta aegis TaxID=1735272 RepID=UPI001B8873B3|nr:interferon-induced protein 44-like [Gigantopelta aegis]
MTTSLGKKHMQQLSRWIGGRKGYTLLFKASRDGCVSQTFHAKCDNQGPTVTVCYNTDRCVFGGYNPLSWNSSGAWTTDNKAFLFKLKFKGNDAPRQYPIQPNNANGMYNHTTYGPTFGSSHDLCVFTNTINRTGNYFQGNNNTNFGTSYNMGGDTVAQITNNNIQFLDIEVYQVTSMFNPSLSITPDSHGYNKSPTVGDKIHCIAFVMDSCTLDVFPDKHCSNDQTSIYHTDCTVICTVMTRHQYITLTAGYLYSNDQTSIYHTDCRLFVSTGIPQVVLLTKVDKLCPEVSEDAAKIFFSDAVGEAVESVSGLVALPRCHVFPVQNYEKEIELNDKIDLPCLIGIKQMLCFADDYLEDYFETH